MVAGLALTAAGPDLLATASGPLLAVAGAACGPALLTAYGRWTRALLGPRTAPARTGPYFRRYTQVSEEEALDYAR
ncbi:hypothetical protein G6539_16755, partial [Streptomyces albidoflavus]|nr:hypothetical protein [Streptomyces albidoflavus]